MVLLRRGTPVYFYKQRGKKLFIDNVNFYINIIFLDFVDYYERVSKKSGMGNSTISRRYTYGIL